MKVAVVVPRPYVHWQGLLDLAEPLVAGLIDLGFDAYIASRFGDADRSIVVGPHLLDRAPPPNTVLYNTEQVSNESPWLTRELLDLYRRHRVWDYDPQNTESLRRLGVNARTVPPGYAPLSPIPVRPKDIDVLFFGSMNARRGALLDGFLNSKIPVRVALSSELYGFARDEACARAKIILNVHFYESKIFEAVRISYLLRNRCFVVTEESTYMPWSGAYVSVPYDELVATCVEYLNLPDAREGIAQAGFDIFSGCTAADAVRAAASEL